ncbi:integrase catalytic domain-containing protein [Trichonephila clavipes]|nr:integrase catalytic domain-containing protein [Trichonephila clavipes]
MSREEKLCEEHFTSTYDRAETDRFIVKMPLSKDPSCLGDSKQMALRRLNSLWRRLVQDPKILELYRNFIHEYLEMGHMEEVVEDEDSAIVYYLPHHGVYRQESKTTPLRVVFNTSSITISGESLTTVTYGTKSAPYLATRSLKQLAIDDGDKYPLAAEVIMSDVYMDDLLTGADDLESGRKLQVQLVSMLKGAGMELHKWSASNPLLLPDSMCQVKDLSYSSSTETKTLGLLWKPHPDCFQDFSHDLKLIVLAWIKKPLAQLKTFVRNRVSIIQELTERDFWKHVNSENNPADILSRGISPDKIQHCELWWFGPPFLHQYKELEPYDITAVEGDDLFLQELKETSDFPLCALLKNFEPLDIISNCSSFTKLQSAEATLANIRNSFWTPSARNVVRKILRTCITCRKVSAKGSQQLMADLPAARVTACRVFSQAIHLEIVSDLTTEAFLAALKRFVTRRGRPIEIHSDNGRNFVGANNELRKILKALFKVGSSLVAVPDPDYTEITMNRLSRWQLVQRMNQHFWGKWSSEYLNRLQQRPKWCKGNVGFKEEDLVLVKPTENSDSLKWHLARILKLHPGKDNIVRVVTLKDKQGIYKRRVTKIANLPYVN